MRCGARTLKTPAPKIISNAKEEVQAAPLHNQETFRRRRKKKKKKNIREMKEFTRGAGGKMIQEDGVVEEVQRLHQKVLWKREKLDGEWRKWENGSASCS